MFKTYLWLLFWYFPGISVIFQDQHCLYFYRQPVREIIQYMKDCNIKQKKIVQHSWRIQFNEYIQKTVANSNCIKKKKWGINQNNVAFWEPFCLDLQSIHYHKKWKCCQTQPYTLFQIVIAKDYGTDFWWVLVCVNGIFLSTKTMHTKPVSYKSFLIVIWKRSMKLPVWWLFGSTVSHYQNQVAEGLWMCGKTN